MLPAAIDNIRQKAFASCTSLANITVKCTYPPTLTEDAFDNNTYQNSKLYVNDVDNYNNQNPWNKFGDNIEATSNYTLIYIADGPKKDNNEKDIYESSV